MRSYSTSIVSSLFILASLSPLGCTGEVDDPTSAASESPVVSTNADLTITFTGCKPKFSGKGVTTGTLPHDGITKCSQDDGGYNLTPHPVRDSVGYHLDLMRKGSQPDRDRIIDGVSWREGQGEESVVVPRAALANVQGLKVWFGGHAGWLTADAIPAGSHVLCSTTLIGEYSAQTKTYAKKWVELDCQPR